MLKVVADESAPGTWLCLDETVREGAGRMIAVNDEVTVLHSGACSGTRQAIGWQCATGAHEVLAGLEGSRHGA
jgi:hypothetical protein